MLPKIQLSSRTLSSNEEIYGDSKTYLEEAYNSDWASGKVNPGLSSEIIAMTVTNNCKKPQCMICPRALEDCPRIGASQTYLLSAPGYLLAMSWYHERTQEEIEQHIIRRQSSAVQG